ncbi:phage head closure protein [Clostridioides mangenotii]|uniref:phage head closure protein n=1 Tax=Metaclostridioides mangenotii TaxID=1540 RepID=UPI002149C98F|nr:phage head closure protein [Clostridioides mangenotii]MCR1955220.1 phage head closure protein [Clostridioides mangenotii]
MRFNKNNGEELNSGILLYGTIETLRDSLGKNPKASFTDEGKLKFKYKSIREMDYSQYIGVFNRLDIKVKTYYVKNIDSTHVVQIEGDCFDIVKIDPDNERMYMYLYLVKREWSSD